MRYAAMLVLAACGPEHEGPPAPEDRAPGRFGVVTSAVVIVNPVINSGSATTVSTGTQRSEVTIEATGVEAVATDSSGLALLERLPTGTVTLSFATGAIDFTVVQERELYDVAVAFRNDGVELVMPVVRYPIGGQIIELAPGADIASAADTDGAIVLLGAGTYPGNFEIRAEGILILGAWTPADGPLSIIDGDVTALGGNGRLRGVQIDGTLSSPANGFSAAFCTVAGADISGNGVTLVRNSFTVGQATVPSSSAILVDNEGIP